MNLYQDGCRCRAQTAVAGAAPDKGAEPGTRRAFAGRLAQASRGDKPALVNDAIRRALQAAHIAGVTALLVHAISEQARRFYLSRGFIESPVKPMTLCLMMATVDQALRES